MSYGPNFPATFRRAADLVDKILRGTKATRHPSRQPTKFEFVINLKPAKALGLEVPPTLLGPRRRGDRMIPPFVAVHESGSGSITACPFLLPLSGVQHTSRIYDGVDAPRRHRCAKVEVLSTT